MIHKNKEKDDALKAFIEANKNLHARLGGSLALKLHGLDLCRKPKDVDVIVAHTGISLPEGFVILEENIPGRASDPKNLAVKHLPSDLALDVLEANTFEEKFNVDEGFPLEHPFPILKAKLEYVFKPQLSDATRHKHAQDIAVILPQIDSSFLVLRDVEKGTSAASGEY